MIHGIGVDILSKTRLEDLRDKYDDPFFVKTYTKSELEMGMGRHDPILYFAERFAVKEAVFKALHINANEFKFSDIETLNDDSGKPYVNLYGHTKKHCDEIGINHLHISISNDSSIVAAFAVCEM